MTKWRVLVLVMAIGILGARAARAAPLAMVNVSAPAINCVFDPACAFVVSDTSATIPLAGAAGTAFLQSRTFKSTAASPAAGRWLYMYRIDLRNAVGILNIPCLSSLSLAFGSVSVLDYDADGVADDQVFVITAGGLGNVAPSSATKVGSTVTFNFSTPICAGGSPGNGDSSYFIGLASFGAPKHVTASLTDTGGPVYSVDARAPKQIVTAPAGVFKGVFQSVLNPELSGDVELALDPQSARRAHGSLMLGGERFEFEATLSESLEFTAVGRGGRLQLHGELEEADELISGQLRYRIRLGDGSVDVGMIVLLSSR
jgi:hypothetical protein